jgi:asparagine synthase (glutamine-hydrolysing)
MIKVFRLNDQRIELKPDLAAEFPVYLYLLENMKELLYATSIKNLLEDDRVLNNLEISDDGISFLLQMGVIPAPNTVYNNLYVLGAGHSADVSVINNRINIKLNYSFPFKNQDRLKIKDFKLDKNFILDELGKSTISKIDISEPTYLFHSSGKDSNMIALALAKKNHQNEITLVTHKSKGDRDESEISKKIARELGFKHIILSEDFDISSISDIDNYFRDVTLPVVDSVTLAYPSYIQQLPDLKGANIIDGGGNDIYMQTPLSKKDKKTFYLSQMLSPFRCVVEKFTSSESKLNPLTKTYIERWCGFGGLTYNDSSKIFSNSFNTRKYLNNELKKRKTKDKVALKTDFLTSIIAAEQHIRKFRSAADTLNSNPIMPFSNQRIAEFFQNMPEKYLFDRKTGKNKLILRKILEDEIGLDSDALGKYGYDFDFWNVLESLEGKVDSEILNCNLWDKTEVKKLYFKLQRQIKNNYSNSKRAKAWVHRLYLISAWYNNNKYVKN